MNRRLKLFLLISVALNIVFIGFVLGRGSHCHRLGMKKAPAIMGLLDRSSIPEARRAELKEKLQAALPTEERRKEKRQWYRETGEILKAEEFDADAYRAQLDKMFAYRSHNRQKIVEVLIEITAELNQEERKALAEIFSRPFAPAK